MWRHSRALIALALFLLSIVSPRIAVAQASAEGLLLATATAGESRERSREQPEQRESESRALILANHAAQLLCIVSAPAPEPKDCDERIERLDDSVSCDTQLVLAAGDNPVLAPRAPPLLLITGRSLAWPISLPHEPIGAAAIIVPARAPPSA